MDEAVIKIIKVLVLGIVAWAISDVVFNILYESIANRGIMPFGWRKSAKGRTVWRIVEEIISQNLELHAHDLGLDEALPADSSQLYSSDTLHDCCNGFVT